jgi:hypothetical protein
MRRKALGIRVRMRTGSKNDGWRVNAQSAAEYSILIAVVIMGFFGMFVYAQRGLQGRYRDMVKATREAVERKGVIYYDYQFEPPADVTIDQSFVSEGNQTIQAGGEISTNTSSTVSAGVRQHDTFGR